MPDLSTSYLGLPLRNPLVIASSGLTDSVEKIVELEKNGAGAVVLKSLFEEEILMEMDEKAFNMTGRPFHFPETFDYMDSNEEENILQDYLSLIREAKAAVKIPVIASINCITAQKWIYFSRLIEEAGADALELNLFFLPSNIQEEPFDSTIVTDAVIDQVKEMSNLPISIKIGYYHSGLATYISRISRSGAKGIVLFNRSWSPDIDIDNLVITSGNILSSPSDLGISLRWIALMAERVDCELAASNGIHSGDAIIKQILAGAQAVQVASCIYQNGPGYIKDMLKDVENWMIAKGFNTLDQFRGKLSHSRSQNPAAYERTQFMKHFRNFVS